MISMKEFFDSLRLHALLDLHSPMSLPFSHPHCDPNVPPSALTLDHLTGMKNRADLMYTAETGLREVTLNYIVLIRTLYPMLSPCFVQL